MEPVHGFFQAFVLELSQYIDYDLNIINPDSLDLLFPNNLLLSVRPDRSDNHLDIRILVCDSRFLSAEEKPVFYSMLLKLSLFYYMKYQIRCSLDKHSWVVLSAFRDIRGMDPERFLDLVGILLSGAEMIRGLFSRITTGFCLQDSIYETKLFERIQARTEGGECHVY